MNEEKITIWEERIHACQNSDLTVAAWCREHQISVATYYYWRKQVCCQCGAHRSEYTGRKKRDYSSYAIIESVAGNHQRTYRRASFLY